MRIFSGRLKKWIWLLTITALAICLGCVFAACTKAQAESADTPEPAGFTESELDADSAADEAAENYSRWLNDHYSTGIVTQEMWLTELSDILQLPAAQDVNEEPYRALTRRYVAETMVKALGYRPKKVDYAADLTARDTALNTLVYYGFFLPDDAGMVYPDAPVTGEEYRDLLIELSRYAQLHGKIVLSFGDSIMFGMGNHDEGIADMIAGKYGMKVIDYSVSGATFGVSSGRSHIPTQIKTAAVKGVKPDLILLNGGTNDIEYTTHGEIVSGFDPKKMNERTYAGGFEYSISLLQKFWSDTPVIYVRAHDMDRVEDSIEQKFGETAMTIAGKWRLPCVDIYDNTDFCTEDPKIRDTYTAYRAKLGHGDSLHPTAYGYAKFYLPLVADEITEQLNMKDNASA